MKFKEIKYPEGSRRIFPEIEDSKRPIEIEYWSFPSGCKKIEFFALVELLKKEGLWDRIATGEDLRAHVEDNIHSDTVVDVGESIYALGSASTNESGRIICPTFSPFEIFSEFRWVGCSNIRAAKFNKIAIIKK